MPFDIVEARPALVVVDLQNGVLDIATTPHLIRELVDRTTQLVQRFRELGFPVVLVNVADVPPGRTERLRNTQLERPAGWADLLPELNASDTDILITKRGWSAFPGTPLDNCLRERSVRQVFITGIATSSGVESTTRSAFDLGYHAVVVHDAVADLDDGLHSHTLDRIIPRIAERCSTSDLVAALGRKTV